MGGESSRNLVVLALGIVLLLAFEGAIIMDGTNTTLFAAGAFAVGILAISQLPDILQPRA